MTEAFLNRVLLNRLLDTRRYRYYADWYPDRIEIKRVPIDKVQTTAMLTDWETIRILK